MYTLMANDETTIRVSKKTKELLDSIGKKPESYDDIVNRVALEHKRRLKKNAP
jgi:hypothetical protein